MEKAKLTVDAFENNNAELKDTLYFLLKDSVHEFTIGLSDILNCLKFAEEKGEIPELPRTWWREISCLYPEFEKLTDVPGDEEI